MVPIVIILRLFSQNIDQAMAWVSGLVLHWKYATNLLYDTGSNTKRSELRLIAIILSTVFYTSCIIDIHTCTCVY